MWPISRQVHYPDSRLEGLKKIMISVNIASNSGEIQTVQTTVANNEVLLVH